MCYFSTFKAKMTGVYRHFAVESLKSAILVDFRPKNGLFWAIFGASQQSYDAFSRIFYENSHFSLFRFAKKWENSGW